jgi:anthranilate phosphoribosyltransferase
MLTMLVRLLLSQKKRPRAEWESLFTQLLHDTQVESLAHSLFLAGFYWNGIEREEVQALLTVLQGERLAMDWRELPLHPHALLSLAQASASPQASFQLAAQFIAAGAGCTVLAFGDHGYGRGVGPSDLLAHLGFVFSAEVSDIQQQLAQGSFAYLDLCTLYPALRRFAPARQVLGLPTVLDQLLPLLYPCYPARLLVGGARPQWLRWYKQLLPLQQQEIESFEDRSGEGYLTLSSDFKRHNSLGERAYSLQDLGLVQLPQQHSCGSIAQEARRLYKILQEKGTCSDNLISLANAAMLIQLEQPQLGFIGALAEAEASLSSGRALATLERLL